MQSSEHGPSTRAVHAGTPHPRIAGSATTPIFQGSVFEYTGATEYAALRYPRLNNLPNHTVLAEKIAALEGTEAGLVTATGMAAISMALLAATGGGHLLIQGNLYGGTFTLLRDEFPQLGIEYDFIDGTAPDTWEARLRPDTRAIYTEAVTNPTMVVADHAAVVEFARAHDLVALVDNTFPSPVNFNPARLGYDIVLHSATKYLNGHSDVAAGAIAASAAWIEKLNRKVIHFGGSLDAHACFLLERGIKTLTLRVARQNENALALAHHLDAHPAIDRVYYPGLASDPGHARATALFAGYGGMLSFEVRGTGDETAAVLDRLQLPVHAPSLGGVESLVTRPVTTSHSGMTASEREAVGVADNLVRMSVGIEDVADLIADLDQALRRN